ncbi:hypothetical protein AVEN_143046-1, partial [Araneus ventricosus]
GSAGLVLTPGFEARDCRLKPDSSEDLPCMWVWCTLNLAPRVKRLRLPKFREVSASSGVLLVI